MTIELAVNLLAAAISFGVGIGYTQVRRWREFKRPGIRVWRMSRGQGVTFVTADGPKADSGEFTRTVYPAEYAAALEIAHYLGSELGCDIDRVCTSSEFGKGEALQKNLVVIGGPVHNKLSEIMFRALAIPFRFEGYSLVDLNSGATHDAEIENGEIVKDVALVVLSPNPYNPESRVVLIAGCRTYGCLAGARYLVHPGVREAAEKVSDSSYLVVESRVHDRFVASGRILVSGVLPAG